jgi:hypothetical protein
MSELKDAKKIKTIAFRLTDEEYARAESAELPQVTSRRAVGAGHGALAGFNQWVCGELASCECQTA